MRNLVSRSSAVLMAFLVAVYPVSAASLPEMQLLDAAHYCDVKRLVSLLDSGVSVDARSSGGQTPLIMAAFGDCPEAVRILLDRGADTNATSDAGFSAADSASLTSNEDVILEMLTGTPAPGATPGASLGGIAAGAKAAFGTDDLAAEGEELAGEEWLEEDWDVEEWLKEEPATANQCEWANDGMCDEPGRGLGLCAAGTDTADCGAPPPAEQPQAPAPEPEQPAFPPATDEAEPMSCQEMYGSCQATCGYLSGDFQWTTDYSCMTQCSMCYDSCTKGHVTACTDNFRPWGGQ